MANIPVRACIVLCLILLSGCADFRVDLAPVESSQPSSLSSMGQHRVKEGETLYSIAWIYGKDERELARLNHLSLPYDITPGQVILVQKPKKQPKNPIKMKPEVPEKKEAAKDVRKKKSGSNYHRFDWPVQGKVISGYSGAQLGGNQGIDIAGNLGDPVRAVGAGKVVYRGEGIRGYGLLVIIKHPDNFLSAYAHNRNILVQEGDSVKAGDVIAEMGSSGTDRAKLHFEIRKAGKPVDPIDYLAQ